ncbi:LysR family transcriptional regulator [Massilia atriviolacea]|uniref:LysR family transcriptional regulator n=1 Tax=Massilia atriviolacea TaxID=2495579 RepID=A0A430HFX4_9BURK|nr:LysR substrate-binding domain-containing protein [Massilia atriviolacea]RSZ56406.1 LysR family transcriptional regulator [Massilia atriviolacea]
MHIPLQGFHTFFVVCRAGSMKQAACELHVSAGAISQRMRELELRHGQRLFERTRTGVTPTAAGAALYADLRAAFQQIETVARRDLPDDAARQLVVSVMPSFASGWLLPRLGDFARRHPAVALAIDSDARVVDLKNEAIDFAIRHGLGSYPGLASRWLMSPEMIVVGAPELLRQGPPIRCPADCLAYPLLHDRERRDWTLWLQASGSASPKARRGLAFSDEHLLVRAACEGQGLALVRDIYAGADLANGRLRKALEAQWPTQFGYYLVGLPDSFAASGARAFVEWIEAEAARSRTAPAQVLPR